MVKNRRKAGIAMALLCLTATALLPGCKKAVPADTRITPMQVSLLKVGKADAIVVQVGEETLVIDTGEEEDGEELVTFLTDRGIARIDTLLITHYDRDHVGGADTVVEALEIGQVILPAYEGSSTEYSDFTAALEEKGIVPLKLTASMTFSLGEATVLVEPPPSYEIPENLAEFDNNFSLITTVVHGEKRFVFAGDAEKQRIRQWLSDGTATHCDFIKMPHHGVYNSALKALLEATTPEFAVICSSAKHPADAQTLELLKSQNVQSWQTKDGNLTVLSDGSDIEIRTVGE